MKIVFMGTPDFAVEPLKALIQKGYEIACVLTRVDKPKGRGHEMMFTPVKQEAIKHGIKVLQPKSLKTDEIYEELKAINADLFVVVAYGMLLPKRILELPKKGCINIHASLLPAYRGATPIQYSIINGDKKTGITTMLMDEGLDTGDILKQYEVEISENETGGSLFDRLAILGSEAIIDTIESLDTIIPKKQGDTHTCYAGMLTKQMGNIDFSVDMQSIERLVRGLNPWPSAYSCIRGKNIKIWRARPGYNTDIEYSMAVFFIFSYF